MSIKINFNEGERAVTVGGLYQWDYGQVLEIECTELGTELMEVHFAYSGLSEAIVRACQFVDGIGTVTIPDQCLEQTSNITAWIYSISATQGHTVKTITMPITGRMRPSALRDVPPEYINKYAEAIEEINKAVNALEQGTVTVAKALSADKATSADTATNAENATYATSAGSTTTGSATVLNMQVISQIEINGGIGTPPTETKYYKVCAVVFVNEAGEAPGTHCGIYCETGGASKYYARIGAFDMVNDGEQLLFTRNGEADYICSGTMYFCKIGGISG